MTTHEALFIPKVTECESTFTHYYDQHPTREDLIGESAAQSQLIGYLINVLRWLYRADDWFVVSNLNIYRSRKYREYPLAPDVAVFKGVVVTNPAARTLRSWRLYEKDRPPPQVVFEIASAETWKEDLNDKPLQYAKLGVLEYYAYDPNEPPYWKNAAQRVRGWRIVDGKVQEQTLDPRGWLWSAELDSWLVPDGPLLRLFDRDSQPRLTEGEAERAAKEAERAAKEQAWAKLRELGVDPESL